MKFVHAADIHLDSPLQALALQDAAQIERMRRATRDAFERMIELCIEQQVAFLVLAGDLYDHEGTNRPSILTVCRTHRPDDPCRRRRPVQGLSARASTVRSGGLGHSAAPRGA